MPSNRASAVVVGIPRSTVPSMNFVRNFAILALSFFPIAARRMSASLIVNPASSRETYGALLYQEQVMMAARELDGFTMSEAHILRAAPGKKANEQMAKLRTKFN